MQGINIVNLVKARKLEIEFKMNTVRDGEMNIEKDKMLFIEIHLKYKSG